MSDNNGIISRELRAINNMAAKRHVNQITGSVQSMTPESNVIRPFTVGCKLPQSRNETEIMSMLSDILRKRDIQRRFDMWIDHGRALLVDLKSMDDGTDAMADMIEWVSASANVETGR